MVLRATVTPRDDAPLPLYVDTARLFPLLLRDAAWKRAGIDVQSLTASPFTVPTKDPNYKYSDIIILLTDGLNTQDRWYTSQSSIDTRQQKTCTNIKAAGITVYTVQVNTGGDPTSTLLQNCASDSSKFFLLTSSNQIITTFNQIGTGLSKLRISN